MERCDDLEAETKRMGDTWGQLQRLALDRDPWKALVGGLCASTRQGDGDDDVG